MDVDRPNRSDTHEAVDAPGEGSPDHEQPTRRSPLRRAGLLSVIATCNALAGWFLTIPVALATFWLGSTLFGDAGYEFTREPRFFAGVGAVSLAICVFLFAAVNLALHLLRLRQTALSLLIALVAFVAPYVVQTPYLWS